MKIRTLFLLPLLLALIGQINAQDEVLSKEEAKKWKNIAKDYKKNPDALKDIIEERNEYQVEVENLKGQIASMESNEPLLQERITQLEQENMQLNTNLMSAQESVRQLTDENAQMASRSASNDMMMGTVFRVQIGAYAKRRVDGAVDMGDNMALEEADGMQKIMIGQFRDYEQANDMMNYFKSIGLKDAWVVPYMDGQRVSLKEALGN